MNEKILAHLYEDISPQEIARFKEFKNSHLLKAIEDDNRYVEYHVSGHGEKTILLMPDSDGVVSPDYAFRHIMALEDEYRVIAPGTTEYSDLDDYCQVINDILDNEDIGTCIVIGGIGGGILAQSYFKRFPGRVEGLILFNTLAPMVERNNDFALLLLKILPSFIVKNLFYKKHLSFFDVQVPKEAEDQLKFDKALFQEYFETRFDKKTVLSMLNLIFEFNRTGTYSIEDFKGWNGKCLIISSEDDPGYYDMPMLMNNLPHAEVFVFPEGYKHLGPLVEHERFIEIVKEVISKLG